MNSHIVYTVIFLVALVRNTLEGSCQGVNYSKHVWWVLRNAETLMITEILVCIFYHRHY